MRTYRIYFLASDHRIVGREDFQAVGDDNALVVAEALYGACSDACAGFSLWDGTRQLDATAPVPFESVDKITRRAQEHVLEVEIRLHDSNWAIASSARLLAQISLLRARLTSEPDTKHAQAGVKPSI